MRLAFDHSEMLSVTPLLCDDPDLFEDKQAAQILWRICSAARVTPTWRCGVFDVALACVAGNGSELRSRVVVGQIYDGNQFLMMGGKHGGDVVALMFGLGGFYAVRRR